MPTTLFSRVRSLWLGLRRRGVLEADMEEEFRLHIAFRAEDLIRSGLPPAEALRRAKLEFGSVQRYKEEGRASRGLRHIDELRGDLRYAVRSLRRSPGFTVVAVLTLALGIGANTAVFSLVSASLLRPLPFGGAERLVVLHQTYAGPGAEAYALRWAYPEFVAAAASLATLSHVAAYAPASLNLSTGEEPVRVSGEIISSAYLPALRVRPALGRWFRPEEDVAASPQPVAILGHELWLRHFGGSADALDGTIQLQGIPLRVVGVAPPGFRGLTGEAELWIPHALAPVVHFPGHLTVMQNFLSVVGRLRPGVALEEARAEVAVVARQGAASARLAAGTAADMPGTWTAELLTLGEATRHPETIRARLVLSAVVFFVLLIAVANFSGLLLARSTARERDAVVRAALGAGRLRLVRQRVVESGLLGVLGGAVGVLLATWSVRALIALAPERVGAPPARIADLASFAEPGVDWRVVAFAVALSLVTGVVAGLVPALRATRDDAALRLRPGTRGASFAVGSLRRPTLLTAAGVTQVACALVLLLAAAMLLQAFDRLRSVDPGFESAGLVSFQVSPPQHVYGGDAAAPLLERILERVEGVPGVRFATVGCPPYSRCAWTSLFIDGRSRDDRPPVVGRHYVGPDHFRTLGVPVLHGRALTSDDRADRPLVALINETAARRFWPGQDPIGQRVWFASGGPFASPDAPAEIVGVVGDILYGAPGDPLGPEFYTSYLQFTWPWATLTVRAATEPAALVPALRRAVAAVDAHLPIHDVRTMEQRGSEALAGERFAATALAVFAALGLLLACLGVYGLMAYSVAQRRREIGIRLALGATPRAIMAVVLRQGAAIAGAGLVLGILAGLGLAGALPALVEAVDPADARILAALAPALLLVALVACSIPARSATRVDPVESLSAD
jgi:putative ABC transport system permease protein